MALKKAKLSKKDAVKKIFVLDTSVILFDHNSILHFEEHDVAIPIPVLEELDEFKKGHDSKNYEAREFIRFLDKKAGDKSLTEWIPLNGKTRGKFKVIMRGEHPTLDATYIYSGDKMDHQILNTALKLQEDEPKKIVTLVTKDINLRLKAKALNLRSEDYQTGKVSDLNDEFIGKKELPEASQELVDKLYKNKSIPVEDLKDVAP